MTDALEAIAPAVVTVAYQDQRLEIRPLTVGQIPDVVRRARPVIDSVLQLDGVPGDDQGALVDLVMDMVSQHGDGIFEAAALLSGAEVALIKRGGLDEFVRLGIAIFEVNRDFFVQRLAPMLADLKAKRGAGAGRTPSTSSSVPATH